MCVWGWELGSAGRDGGGRAREATSVERLVQLRTANRRPRSLRLSLWSPPCGRPRVGFRRAPPPLQVPALLSFVLHRLSSSSTTSSTTPHSHSSPATGPLLTACHHSERFSPTNRYALKPTSPTWPIRSPSPPDLAHTGSISSVQLSSLPVDDNEKYPCSRETECVLERPALALVLVCGDVLRNCEFSV